MTTYSNDYLYEGVLKCGLMNFEKCNQMTKHQIAFLEGFLAQAENFSVLPCIKFLFMVNHIYK